MLDHLLRARLSVAKTSLFATQFISQRLAGRAQPRLQPRSTAKLPQHDANRARGAEVAFARELYALGPAHDVLQLSFDLRHDTVKNFPEQEGYAAEIKLPKMFLLAGFSVDVSSEARWASVEQIRACYSVLGEPSVVGRWELDAEFGRQRLQGAHPCWVRRVESLDRLVQAGLAREHVEGAGLGRIDPRELYVVDYQAFLKGLPRNGRKYIYPCLGLFREAMDGGLMPVGVQLELDSGEKVFRVPDGSAAWTLAKMFFQSADFWVHEVVSHYLWTHVYQEKFVFATARHLHQTHPVRRLLAPHFDHTLQVNRSGAPRLLHDDGVFAANFTPGIEGMKRGFALGNELWHFDRLVLPEQLAGRGMKDLPYYPYRDDALLHWEAIDEYVRAYLGIYYDSAAELAGDAEIAAWHDELFLALGDRGLPELRDLETLRLLLVAIIFNVIQHELVNNLQYDSFGFAPAAPSVILQPMPANPKHVTPQTILRALPDVGQSLRAMLVTYGFAKQYSVLGQHAPYVTEPEPRRLAELYALRLREIEATIGGRNAQRAVPYTAALPSRMSNSTNA